MKIKEKAKTFWQDHKCAILLCTYTGIMAGIGGCGCYGLAKATQKEIELLKQDKKTWLHDDYLYQTGEKQEYMDYVYDLAILGLQAMDDKKYAEDEITKIIQSHYN